MRNCALLTPSYLYQQLNKSLTHTQLNVRKRDTMSYQCNFLTLRHDVGAVTSLLPANCSHPLLF